ncbi:MAG: SMP-30/gluconolactonase/LRE family protein [Cyanobacteria bacterium J06560_2]
MDTLVDPGASLLLIDNSCEHTEGPVYIPADDSVVWSDTKGDRVLKYKAGQVTTYREPARFQNGNALDLEDRIVACSHLDRAIVRQEKTGEWKVLVDRYQGKRLNSPNDGVVKSDGTIWFTDPPFGLINPEEGCGGDQEQFGSFVFRFDPATAEINAVVTEMEKPNGLAFSPDESLLYISDTSAAMNDSLPHHILAYEIVEGRTAKNGSVFATVSPGEPDGFCLDAKGNIFTSAKDGVQIYSPAGSLLGKIKVPEVCANVTFGGDRNQHLFITAGKSLYSIQLKTPGK